RTEGGGPAVRLDLDHARYRAPGPRILNHAGVQRQRGWVHPLTELDREGSIDRHARVPAGRTGAQHDRHDGVGKLRRGEGAREQGPRRLPVRFRTPCTCTLYTVRPVSASAGVKVTDNPSGESWTLPGTSVLPWNRRTLPVTTESGCSGSVKRTMSPPLRGK